jgi:hypothetical protein
MEQPPAPTPESDEEHASGRHDDEGVTPDADHAGEPAEDPAVGGGVDAPNDTAPAGSEADRPAQS